MRQKKEPDEAYAPAVRQNFIDTVALAAAALWFVIMALFSWHLNNIPISTAIERALIGAIIIYVGASIAFHIIIRAALKAQQKLQAEKVVRRPTTVATKPSNVSEEPVEEK